MDKNTAAPLPRKSKKPGAAGRPARVQRKAAAKLPPAAAIAAKQQQAPVRHAEETQKQPAPIDMNRKTAEPAAEPLSFRRELLSLLPSLRAFAISLSGRADRADDLLQDTIMRAWAKQESFVMGTNMKAWLFTILRNEFYSQMRKQGREVQDTDGMFANNLAVHPAQYGSLDLQDFKQALDKLPADQREAIILIGASGFSYEEAAEICQCAIGTIKSRVSRARARLQSLLGIESENDYGPDADSAASTMRSF